MLHYYPILIIQPRKQSTICASWWRTWPPTGSDLRQGSTDPKNELGTLQNTSSKDSPSKSTTSVPNLGGNNVLGYYYPPAYGG